MKKINFIITALLITFVISSLCFAQQDYQVVQNFKKKEASIQQAIHNASSLDTLNQIQTQIEQLKTDFESHKDLLDNSLYPDDFNTSIAKLNKALALRKGDFTKITTLKTQVSQMQIHLDSLSAKNSELLSNVQQLEIQGNKDRHTILLLERDKRELRYSLRRRDMIVMTMLDSLLPNSNTGNNSLTSGEKRKVYSETKRLNVVSNIKRAINDNIQFLNVTSLMPADLNSIKIQQQQFEKIWRNVGPEIIKIYSSKGKSVKNLTVIDNEFGEWNRAINQEAWNSIRQEFNNHGIILDRFSNGAEFSQVLNSYINDEIKNSDLDSKKAVRDYHTFVDSVWLAKVEPEWVPYLTKNKMWPAAAKNKLEARLKVWKSNVVGSFNWLYVIIPLAAVLLFVFIFVKSRSSDKNRFETENA